METNNVGGGVVLESMCKYSGKNTYLISHGGDSAANRALERVGESGYNLLTRNCEHFATACTSGGSGHSAQVSSSIVGGPTGAVFNVVSRPDDTPGETATKAAWSTTMVGGAGFIAAPLCCIQ